MCTLWFRASTAHLSPLAGTMLLGETRNTTWPLGSHTPGEIQPPKGGVVMMAPKVLSEIRLDVEKKSCQDAKGSQAQRHNGHQKNTLTLANQMEV